MHLNWLSKKYGVCFQYFIIKTLNFNESVNPRIDFALLCMFIFKLLEIAPFSQCIFAKKFSHAESIIFERSRFNLAFHPHTIYMAAFGLYYPIMLEYLGQCSPPSRLLIVPTRNRRRLTSRSTLHWASAKLLSLVIHFGDFDTKLVLSFWHFCYIFGYFQNTYGQVTLIHLFTAQWWRLTHTHICVCLKKLYEF